MKKKILFFDIDGTLLNDEKKLLRSTKEALQELQSNGHEIAIATGRNYAMAKIVIDELGLKNYIVCNGAAGFFHDEQVYENPLDAADFERLLTVADRNQHQMVYETPFMLKRRDEFVDANIKTAMEAVGFGVPEYDSEFHKNNKLVQALLFYREEDKALYENGVFPKFKFVRWHDAGVDILPRGGSKAKTILKLSADQGFQREDIIAFGDGLNDLEMISEVGTGVAMGNALETIKLRADKVTANNNENGIAIALKEMNLI